MTESIEPEKPVPERSSLQGEWSDWDNEAYLEEEYVDDDDDDDSSESTLNSSTTAREILSYQTNTLLQTVMTNVDKKLSTTSIGEIEADAVYKRDDKDWIGWSEEPPYFDDDDIEEETILEFDKADAAKTKFGYGGERGVYTQSTDLWTKRNILEETPKAATNQFTELSPTPVKKNEVTESSPPSINNQQVSSLSSAQQQQPQLDQHSSLLLFIEMNRKFESLERKLDSLQASIQSPASTTTASPVSPSTPSIASFAPIMATLFLIGYAFGSQVNN